GSGLSTSMNCRRVIVVLAVGADGVSGTNNLVEERFSFLLLSYAGALFVDKHLHSAFGKK
ncbi:hypothetical protein STEG23_030439, partial [Scotinomys teguina]